MSWNSTAAAHPNSLAAELQLDTCVEFQLVSFETPLVRFPIAFSSAFVYTFTTGGPAD